MRERGGVGWGDVGGEREQVRAATPISSDVHLCLLLGLLLVLCHASVLHLGCVCDVSVLHVGHGMCLMYLSVCLPCLYHVSIMCLQPDASRLERK
jgi:hypothetical protein